MMNDFDNISFDNLIKIIEERNKNIDLRDQFAMEIAPALISLYGKFIKVNGESIAKESYEIADAMMKARKCPPADD